MTGRVGRKAKPATAGRGSHQRHEPPGFHDPNGILEANGPQDLRRQGLNPQLDVKKWGGRSALRRRYCKPQFAALCRCAGIRIVVGSSWLASGSKKLFSSITCAVFENNKFVDGQRLSASDSSTEIASKRGAKPGYPTTILAGFLIFDEKKMITGTVQR